MAVFPFGSGSKAVSAQEGTKPIPACSVTGLNPTNLDLPEKKPQPHLTSAVCRKPTQFFFLLWCPVEAVYGPTV